ncbi:transposase [Streptomyces sp. NPDC056796]|uniref:transposase n=1 Tax=Streptomyces sp. NPDC056796 TaxID=3345947 RepID=UPI0036B0E0EC
MAPRARAAGQRERVGAVKAPVVVADAGYGVSTPFRHSLEERALSYVLALTGKEVAHELDIEPHQPDYGGLGPPTLARYRTTPRALTRPRRRGSCRRPLR